MIGIKAVIITSLELVYVSMAPTAVLWSVPEPMAGHH